MTHRLMHEHVGKHAKMQRSKESQTGGTRQAYQHRTKRKRVCIKHTNTTGVFLTNGYIQLILRRDECDHTSTSPRRAQSIVKPRSREANTEIKYRSKQANIEMQRK